MDAPGINIGLLLIIFAFPFLGSPACWIVNPTAES